jgi:SAM-dependent methyltransferase
MYSRPQVIEGYAQEDALQPPERSILNALAPRMAGMTMLDIGVGAGRLTAHFAPRVKDYHGIDLAPEMVAYCRRRFAGRIPAEKFAVRDMRELESYPGQCFDLVLNSYNTIDHLDRSERARFLLEARRLVRPGGYLCFAAHNIRAVLNNLRICDWHRAWRHPRNTAQRLWLRVKFLAMNRGELRRAARADDVIVRNGTHGDFSLDIHYVRPERQINALAQAGFNRVSVYSLDTGAELTPQALASSADRWLYYLCS